MRFSAAIDLYVADRRSQGAINSANTENRYRHVLHAHCDDVADRSPAKTGRDDVKRTLRRYPHPNTQRQAHAILTSFYDWCMEESIRDTNPARMVRRAKARQVSVYRPTRDEVVALCAAARTQRERWVIHLGVLAGLRREELRLLRGRHFARAGYVHVSADIAKGARERWVPVLPELEPVIAEIRRFIALDAFVFPSRRPANRLHTEHRELTNMPMSAAGIYRLVKRVGTRAELGAEIGPHTLRHAFGDHVARYAGLKVAQALMGHASSATTEASYTGRATLDELSISVRGFAYGLEHPTETRSTLQGQHNVDSVDPASQSQNEEESS